MIKDMYKENLSKSITGMKNKNNKTLFLSRNEYLDKYVERFKIEISKNLETFDELRKKETLYKLSWESTVKSLKNII